MARSDSCSSGADLPPSRSEDRPAIIDTSSRLPRRLLTLVTISTLLNILLWTSVICIASSIYQVASDPHDITNIAPVVLTSTSALATILYTAVHTVFSFKQKIWSRDERHASAIQKTDYVAVRMVVALCAFWLVTCGWNMIIVARRPVCAQMAIGLQTWEYGPRCYVSRAGIAFAMIALAASCALFGVLATVRRPFEAHLFRHGFQRPQNPLPAFSKAERPCSTRRTSYASEKHPLGHRRSESSYRTAGTNFSGTDGDMLDWNFRLPASSTRTPSPVQSLGLGIFTSNSAPPPIPSAYTGSPRLQPLGAHAPLINHAAPQPTLTRPPRLSGHGRANNLVPPLVAAEYSASTLRALHPPQSSVALASRSQSHLPTVGFPYRGQYSRSNASLTRPHRLSTVTPAGGVDWIPRSRSTEPLSERMYNPSSVVSVTHTSRSGSITSESSGATQEKALHLRPSSAPSSGAMCGAVYRQPSRMAMGWKPQLAGPQTQKTQSMAIHSSQYAALEHKQPFKLVQSASAGFLSNFSPDIAPNEDDSTFNRFYRGQGVDSRMHTHKPPPIRRSYSANEMLSYDATTGAVDPAKAAAAMLSKMPTDIRMHTRKSSGASLELRRKTRFDDLKNKPLPRIAML